MSESPVILHMSDIQFGKHHRFGPRMRYEGEEAYNTLLAKTLEDLDKLRERYGVVPNIIVVTGDLAEWSRPDEYDEVSKYLSHLSNHCVIPKERIVLVPGNHDVNHKLCQAARLTAEATEQDFKVPYFPKFSNFERFFNEFYQGKHCFTEDLFVLYDLADHDLIIVSFNSCEKETEIKVDHYGYIGLDQVHKAGRRCDDIDPTFKRLRIAAFHHNFRGVTGYDNENLLNACEIEPALEEYRFTVLMHGHSHTPALKIELNPVTGQSKLILGTGSAGLDSETLPDNPNRYQVIKIVNQHEFTVFMRQYSALTVGLAGMGKWIADSSCAAGGIVQVSPPDDGKKVARWEDIVEACKFRSSRFLDEASREKYKASLYVRRRELEDQFAQFLESDKSGFAIVGPSGVGKTNLLCHLAQSYSDKSAGLNNAVLLYNAAYLETYALELHIERDLGLAQPFTQASRTIAQLADKENAYLLVFVDAINEFRHSTAGPLELLKHINHLVADVDSPRIKFVFTCRTSVWEQLLTTGSLPISWTKYFTEPERPERRLCEFTEEELSNAYLTYQSEYELETDFQSLSRELRERCRSPLFLNFLCKVYRGRTVPGAAPLLGVFEGYYQQFVYGHKEMFLRVFIEEMLQRRSNHLFVEELLEHRILSGFVIDQSLESPFHLLISDGILYPYVESGRETVKITYERFFEFLLAKRLLASAPSLSEYVNWVRTSVEYRPLWEAVKLALLMSRDSSLLRELASLDDYFVSALAIETFSEIDDLSEAQAIILDLARADSIAARKTSLKAAYELGMETYEVILRSALFDVSRGIRSEAAEYFYLLWNQDKEQGFRILGQLGNEWKIQFEARSEEERKQIFEFCLDLSLKILTNHHREASVLHNLKSFWLELPGVALLLRPRITEAEHDAAQHVKNLVIAVAASKWGPILERMLGSKVFPVSHHETQDIERILPYLEAATEKAVIDNMKETFWPFFESHRGLRTFLAQAILVVHANTNFDVIRPLLTSFFEKGDGFSRYLVLTVLNVGAQSSRDVAGSMIPTMERLANRFIEDNRDVLLTTRPFGDQSYHPIDAIGNVFCHAGYPAIDYITDLSEKAARKGDIELLARVITDLGTLGMRHPQIVLLTLDAISNKIELSKLGLGGVLANSLAMIRAIRPYMIDYWLVTKGSGADLIGGVKMAMDPELVSRYLDEWGLSNFIFVSLVEIPHFRTQFAHVIRLLLECHDFTEFMSVAIDRVTNYVQE